MGLHFTSAPELNIAMLNADTRSLQDTIRANRDEIIDQLNQCGAVLFRGFACEDDSHFSEVIALCDLGTRCSTRDYDIARTLLPNEIYTSSDLPGAIALPLHHEKPRTKNPPHHIYFCCVTPPTKGGGTVLANAADIWLAIPRGIQDKIIEHGVTYKQFFHGNTPRYRWIRKLLNRQCARSWVDYFGTEEKTVIEDRLKKDETQWDWIGSDLLLQKPLSGVLNHPISNQPLWFNGSHYLNYYSNLLYGELKQLRSYHYLTARYLMLKDMLPMVCHYGNGQAFSADEIKQIRQATESHSRVFHWQKGDFMIVDNFTFMHGKEPHQGDRLLYSCMTEYAP